MYKRLKDLDPEETAEKYRTLNLMINAIMGMPSSLKTCKLQGTPYIPPEFRSGKLPPNMFFKNFEFSLEDISLLLEELKEIYGAAIHPEVKKGIDKLKS